MSYPNIIQQINSKLPLSGGTITGIISSSNDTFLNGTTNNKRRHICSGVTYNKGAYICLDGCEVDDSQSNYYKGQFFIGAHNGTDTKILVGRPDGTLTWGGNNVDTVVSSGSGYIRYSSGLQICYGRITVNCSSGGDTGAVWNFPLPFSEAPSIVCNDTGSVDGVVWIARASSPSTTSCRILLRESAPNGPWRDGTTPTIAIGRWK